MKDKIESWLLNVLAGKLVARLAVTAVAYVAAPASRALLGKLGVSVSIDPTELAAGMIALGHAAFEWFKARRMANENSPATQTNPALIAPVVVPPQP